MNSKDIKRYDLLTTILNAPTNADSVAVNISALAEIDFGVAFEVWEYVLRINEARLGDITFSHMLEKTLFAKFMELSETKVKALLLNSLPLIRLVYGVSASSCEDANLQFLCSLILSGKPQQADELLRCVRSNTTGDFGERMKVILESVFALYCTRNDVKKVTLNRAQSTLLLGYIGKIKGPNKNLLFQRIKEL